MGKKPYTIFCFMSKQDFITETSILKFSVEFQMNRYIKNTAGCLIKIHKHYPRIFWVFESQVNNSSNN